MADKAAVKTPKPMSAAEKAKKDAAAKRMAEYLAKRKTKLTELKAKDLTRFQLMINIKEAKAFGLVPNEPVPGQPAPWVAFCEMKKQASQIFWENAKSRRVANAKTAEKKKLRASKLKEALAKIEAEMAAEGIA